MLLYVSMFSLISFGNDWFLEDLNVSVCIFDFGIMSDLNTFLNFLMLYKFKLVLLV